MIQVRLYSPTGEKGEKVSLSLRKSDVGYRLWTAIQKGEGNVSELTALDSGNLALSRLAKLYSVEELREAIQRRRAEMARESEELIALDAFLEQNPEFAEPQGGDAAVRSSYRRRA